jgi:hypothetical protein
MDVVIARLPARSMYEREALIQTVVVEENQVS